MDIRGKKVLVTGTRRLGSAIALDLARAGADVCLTYRNSRKPAEEAAGAIWNLGRRAGAIQADLDDPQQVAAAVEATVGLLGGLDVLVNVASIWEKQALAEAGAGAWDANMAANARAAYLLAREVAPQMKKAGGGHIINFADWLPASGRPRYKGYPAYYASKAALIAATEALALELASDNILVNAVAPGPVLAQEGISDEENAEVLKATPLGRWGGEESVCQAVRALLMCDFVTGETLRVDGGRHLR